MAPSVDGDGYAVLTSFGRLFGYGDFPDDGDASGLGARRPDRGRGDCKTGATAWPRPTGASSTTAGPRSSGRWAGGRSTRRWSGWRPPPPGQGYWFVAADGGIFDYGDAPFHGSMGGRH